jgi:cytochrome c5
MKTIFKITVVLGLSLLASCQSNTYDEITAPTTTTVTARPTYQNDLRAVMTSKCTGCHSVSGRQLPYLETYAQVKDAVANGAFNDRIKRSTGTDGIMPPSGRLPQPTIDLIDLWVTQGYAN